MSEKDDQQWLDALSGRPDAKAKPITNAQAQALRSAMVARRIAIEHAAAKADPAAFEKLQARLQREGLLPKADGDAKQTPTRWLGAMLRNWLTARADGLAAVPVWSLAANVVLGVAVVVQLGFYGSAQDGDTDVLRGGITTVLLVPSPQARLAELSSGLDQAKAHYVVLRKPSGEVHLLVQAEDAAFDYLLKQRIEPKVSEGMAVIVLRKP